MKRLWLSLSLAACGKPASKVGEAAPPATKPREEAVRANDAGSAIPPSSVTSAALPSISSATSPAGEGKQPQAGDGEQLPAGERKQPQAGDGEQLPAGEGKQPQTGDGEQLPVGEGKQPQTGDGEQLHTGAGRQPQVGDRKQPPTSNRKPLDVGHHEVDVDGVALAYEVRGSGPPCLVIPGGPGLDAGYLHSTAFDNTFLTIYVDLLGTGRSGAIAVRSKYSMKRDVESIEALRRALGLERVCVIGHSYGGFVALRFAIEHPDRVAALGLYSTTAATDARWVQNVQANTRWFAREPWFARAMAALAAEGSARSQAELEAAFRGIAPLYFARWNGNETRFREALGRSKLSFAVARHREHAAYNVRDKLGSIRAPTVVIAADRDFICGLGPARELARAIGNAKLVAISGAGHYAHVEQPEAFAKAVRELAAKLE